MAHLSTSDDNANKGAIIRAQAFHALVQFLSKIVGTVTSAHHYEREKERDRDRDRDREKEREGERERGVKT